MRNKTYYILMIVVTVLTSCQNRVISTTLFGENNKKIDILETYNRVKITKDKVEYNYIKNNNQLVCTENNKIFLTLTTGIIDKQAIESFYGDSIITKVYKVHDYKHLKDFRDKELYVRRTYIDGSKYGKDMEFTLSEVFFDKDLKIYAVNKFEVMYYDLLSNKSCPYLITHKRDTITISSQKGEIYGKTFFSNGEYVDASDHKLFMSTLRDTVFSEKTTLFDSATYITKINKTNRKNGNKNIYTSQFYIRRSNSKKEQLLIAYYYDENYHITSISAPKFCSYKLQSKNN